MAGKAANGAKGGEANEAAAWAAGQQPALPAIAFVQSAGIRKFTNAGSHASNANARSADPR